MQECRGAGDAVPGATRSAFPSSFGEVIGIWMLLLRHPYACNGAERHGFCRRRTREVLFLPPQPVVATAKPAERLPLLPVAHLPDAYTRTALSRRSASVRTDGLQARLRRANPAPCAPKVRPELMATPASRARAAGSSPQPSWRKSTQAR